MYYLAFLYGWLRKRSKMQRVLWADWLLTPAFFSFSAVASIAAILSLCNLQASSFLALNAWLRFELSCLVNNALLDILPRSILISKPPWRATLDLFTVGFLEKVNVPPLSRKLWENQNSRTFQGFFEFIGGLPLQFTDLQDSTNPIKVQGSL